MTTTKGHLSNNGGIRGHSAGEFFPFIVFAQGSPFVEGGVKWLVRKPSGEVASVGFTTSAAAHKLARRLYKEYIS